MTSAGSLAILVTRSLMLFAIPFFVIIAPESRVALFLLWIPATIALLRLPRVPLAPVHRHIYFAVIALGFSIVCSLGLYACARVGTAWWILMVLAALFAVMLFSLARSIYRPHAKA